ncbi:MAG: hypothetical protein NT018_03810 [Armatimonadetes bacterium]|nr:hypothetical protein [Armatimonadota bacterium]
MTIVDNRWEHGSFFHWMSPSAAEEADYPWGEESVLCGSGRDAFRVLIEHGRAKRGWKRLYVPCYYCQEVVESLLSTGIDVRLYPDGPQDVIVRGICPRTDNVDLRPGDVVLRVDFFGMRGSLHTELLPGIETIDDFSHDPWSYGAWKSNADWCAFSLRKTLPIPDGGVLWSPRSHHLPPQPPVTPEHRLISLERLAAMALKTEYLNGKPIQKNTFLELAIASEVKLSKGTPSGMTEWSKDLLNCFPTLSWRQRRRANYEAFAEVISGTPWLRLLHSADNKKSCPFSAIFICDNVELRNHIRDRLILLNIYPATLWPLDEPAISGIPQEYLDFSRKMLSIQCDARYTCEEMQRVAKIVIKSGDNYLNKHQEQPTQQSNPVSGGV